jgi:hypothetical protein
VICTAVQATDNLTTLKMNNTAIRTDVMIVKPKIKIEITVIDLILLKIQRIELTYPQSVLPTNVFLVYQNHMMH